MSKTKVIRRAPGLRTQSFSPKTSRGRRLLEFGSKKIIAAGIPLQSPEEIDEEVRERNR